jgi:hypothetical protein
MDLERRPKLVLRARGEGGRGRGRPRLEWEEYVERMTLRRGRKLPDVKRLAQDRKEYGNIMVVVGIRRLTAKGNEEEKDKAMRLAYCLVAFTFTFTFS